MTVVEVQQDAWISQDAVREIRVDVRVLGDWASPASCAGAAEELERVRQALIKEGVAPRSASRMSAALARYAFLASGDFDPSRPVLWRLHAVDGVPADVLAQLTWHQVRTRLREIAVRSQTGSRYFALSSESCRRLVHLRDRAGQAAHGSAVFAYDDHHAWQPECLAEALSAISMR